VSLAGDSVGPPQALAIVWQVAMQRRQASAQRWQCSALCLEHSAAQASQRVAQRRHRSPQKRDSRLQSAEHNQQRSAQSRQCSRQSAISGPDRAQQFVMQLSHSSAQATHSSIHFCRASFVMVVLQCWPKGIQAGILSGSMVGGNKPGVSRGQPRLTQPRPRSGRRQLGNACPVEGPIHA